jgi:hypothetical protein
MKSLLTMTTSDALETTSVRWRDGPVAQWAFTAAPSGFIEPVLGQLLKWQEMRREEGFLP